MPDPRSFMVAPCSSSYAARSVNALALSSSTRRDFFGSLAGAGALAVANSVTGGVVGQGLQNLASISNVIQQGGGALPSIVGGTLASGTNWVLSQVGIAPSAVAAVSVFEPLIASQAVNQAQSIFQSVQQGAFNSTQIPQVISSLQNLQTLSNNIFTPGIGDAQSSLSSQCAASPYAVDLIARAPKYKFLFIVQFVANNSYSQLNADGFDALSMAFTVKKSSRPNIKFQAEDVNYYNFRTKVITRTEFEEMTMSFYDDITNNAMNFYRAYLRAMSPITGITTTGGDSTILESRGMDFISGGINNTLVPDADSGGINANTYAASHGPLAGDVKNVFKEIVLYHIYDYGNFSNVFHFLNPRITALNFDELDMSVGTEGTEISLNFNYDSVYIEPAKSLAEIDLAGLQRGAIYPLEYNGSPTPAAPNISGASTIGVPGYIQKSSDPLQPINNASAALAGVVNNAVATANDNLSTVVSNIPNIG